MPVELPAVSGDAVDAVVFLDTWLSVARFFTNNDPSFREFDFKPNTTKARTKKQPNAAPADLIFDEILIFLQHFRYFVPARLGSGRWANTRKIALLQEKAIFHGG